jgi:hypothetical protein
MIRAIQFLAWAIAFIMIPCDYVSADAADSSQVIIHLCSSDLMKFPEGRSEGSIDEVEFVSSSLKDLLVASGAEKLARAYPNYTAADTLIIDFEGKPVIIGDLTRVVAVDFEAKRGADGFLHQVKTPESLKMQKNLMNKLIQEKNLRKASIGVIAEEIGKNPEIRELKHRHQQNPEINWAEPNYPGRYSSAVTDPLVGLQWNLKYDYGINAITAWDLETETRWPIAILDRGGMHTHRDITFTGCQTGLYAHGLAAAGIAGALTNNGLDMAGIAWNTNFGAFNAGAPDPNPSQTAGAIYDAMSYGIMNISACFVDEAQCYGLGQAVRIALNAGKLLCCAAGNTGAGWPDYPAYWALAVGATKNNKQVASYSNRRPDLVAPGGDGAPEGSEDILSLWYEDPYFAWWTGTSFAAPQAAGVAGLISQAYYCEQGYYQCTRSDLQRLMEVTATDLPPDEWDIYSGWGLVNARAALELIQGTGPNRIKRLTASGYDDYEESDVEVMSFIGVEDLPVDDFLVKRNTMYKNVTWSHPCQQVPRVWVNEQYTTGYSSMDPQYGTLWGYVVDGSVTATGATLYTNIYQVFGENGATLGWYPCERHEVSFSYSVLGEFNLFQPSLAVTLVQNGDNHYFQVTWTDSNEFHEGYRLECKRGGGCWETVANLPPTCHSYNYAPVWGSQMYYFRVRATWGESHVSQWSNEVGIRNVPNPPADVHVSLKWVCGWPDIPKTVSTWDNPAGSEGGDLVVPTDMSQGGAHDLGDRAPEPPPGPPCFPTNLAYVSWEPPENQIEPVDYYKVRLLLYLGGQPTVYWVGPFTAEACTLCLWPNKEYRLSVVAHKYGLHSDETVGTQVFTTGEAIICSDYCHKASPPQAPEPDNPEITSSLASADRCLIQNHPNPFNPETDISYNLPEDCMVKLVVYNMLGQRVRVLVEEQQTAGLKTVHWDGKDDNGNELASGVYFSRLKAANHVEAKKMILMR